MLKNNLEFLVRMAKGITAIFGERRCEVVVHDFTDITKSVVHIEGDLTQRPVGAPITDLVYRLANEFGKDAPDRVGYRNTLDNGKTLKCSTIFVRDDDGKLEGCVCINFDVSDFIFLSKTFAEFNLLNPVANGSEDGHPKERYAKDFAETMESVIDVMLDEYPKVPAMMDRDEKKKIVRKLDKSGVFKIKGAVLYLAKVLGVTRYTIYSYLKEVREE
jgi:predicted transcriptional regulator YheO